MSTDTFQLTNDPPSPTAKKPEPQEAEKQKVLFSGMDCLPGQLDFEFEEANQPTTTNHQ